MPRRSPLELDARRSVVSGIALSIGWPTCLASLPSRPVTSGRDATFLRHAIGEGPVPDEGADPESLLDEVTAVLIEHSLYNGHPRFMGYITSSPAPLGAVADLVAAAVNPNCGSFRVSPVGTLIEEQVVKWSAELLGLPPTTAGLLVSGGNMANMVGFWAARTARAGARVREGSMRAEPAQLVAYCSAETHTWIQKAADLSGLGTNAIRWIPVNGDQRMRVADLEAQLAVNKADGLRPFLVVGTGQAAWGPARWIRCPRSRASAAITGCGFTSTAPMAHRRSSRTRRRPIWPRCRKPTRSRSIHASGFMRRSKPAARSSAIRRR